MADYCCRQDVVVCLFLHCISPQSLRRAIQRLFFLPTGISASLRFTTAT
jgi:hypothetical protein